MKVNIPDRVMWWRAHYRTIYHLVKPNFSHLRIPDHQPGFDRLIILPRGFTLRCWVETIRRIGLGLNLSADDLDTAVPHNDRRAKGRPYAIWVRDRQEADEELKDKSANMLKEEEIKGICLPEQAVNLLAYLWEKGQHLDEVNITLCSGSRFSGDGVPGVLWRAGHGRVYVDWCSPDSRCPRLRARGVVF